MRKGLSILVLALVLMAIINIASMPAYAGMITVTNLNDSGAGSLRQAIADASSGDTINFSVTGTITTQSELYINKNLTLNGPGAGSLTVSRNTSSSSNFSVFRIAEGANATIKGVKISGGTGYTSGGLLQGGGIYSNGNLSLLECVISGNSARDGGGIYSRNMTTTATPILFISNSTVSGNTASSGYGGGIFSQSSTITISNSTISGNSLGIYGGDGGGGMADYYSTITISNSTISGNEGTIGGGIYSYQAAAFAISNSTVSGNTAALDVGGIFLHDASSPATISTSTISGNWALGVGGGIASQFSTLTISNSTISGNSGLDAGGGMFSYQSTLTISNSTISSNLATGNGATICTYCGKGGGLYLEVSSTFTISNSTITDNAAHYYNTNGIFLDHSTVKTASSIFKNGCYYSSSTVILKSYSIDMTGTCGGGLIVDPLLGPLADNGGPTKTHALLAGSPAIDAGGSCSGTDQRGISRPQGSACDIGAYEVLSLGTVTINNNDAYTSSANTTLALSCIGCSNMRFSKDNITWYGWETFSTTRGFTLLSGEGTKYAYVQFKDSAGNLSPIYADTIIVDTTAPIGSVSINGGLGFTNSTSSTLTLICSDGTGSGCKNMRFSKDNVTWYGWETFSTTRSVTLTPEGNGTKYLYVQFKDVLGNISQNFSDSIVLDQVAPTGTITVNGGAVLSNSASATLTIACNDGTGSGCSTMQFSNNNLTWSTAVAFANTVSWTLSSGDGAKTVYAKFKDSAGNVSQPSSDTIVLDSTLPTGTITINSGIAFTNSASAMLTLGCSDGSGSGCANMRFSKDNVTWYGWEPFSTTRGVTLTPAGGGTKIVYVQFKDSVGNISTTYSDSIYFGVTGTVAINSGAAYTNLASATVNLTCSNGNGNLCTNMRFSKDNVTWYGWETFSATRSISLTPTGNGIKYIYTQFKDGAGNISQIFSDTIVLDQTAPTGSASINNGAGFSNSTSAVLSLVCNDAGGSGCTNMRFSKDNVTWYGWETFSTTRNISLTPAGSGTKYIYVQFKDNAGNISQTFSDTIILDQTAPTGSVSINSGADFTNTTSVTLGLACNDGSGSGCAQVQTSIDNATWSGWTTFSTTKSVTLAPSGSITKYAYVKFKDAMGNISQSYSDTIILDQTIPTGTITINNGAVFTNSASATLSLACNDGTGSGCSTMQFSNDNTSWSNAVAFANATAWTLSSGSGMKTVFAKFKDGAGNVSSTYSDTIAFGVTGTVAINNGASATVLASASLNLSCNDANGNACTNMRFSKDNVTWYGWETFSTTRNISLTPAGNGIKYIYAQFKDGAGNVSSVYSDTIELTPYIDNGNGTVTDSVGRMWQKQDDATTRTWDNAVYYCDNLSLGGYADWRLPSKNELLSLVNTSYHPAINTTYFPNTKSSLYWSSTTASMTYLAWSVEFYDGYAYSYMDKSYSYYVRCVR